MSGRAGETEIAAAAGSQASAEDLWRGLARRIEAGDRSAESELVSRLDRGLSYLLRRLTGDPELSQDLSQETFRIVLESLRAGRLEDPGKVAGFVRGTARNLVHSEWRKKDRRGPHEEVSTVPLEDPGAGQLERAQAVEDRERVRRLLAEMTSERDRQILRRHYLTEEPKAQICRDLQIGETQFNLVLFRARGRFRQLLEREEKRFGLLRRLRGSAREK
ncbi:MAG: RNA polymerase sigma factor [Acidobacteriota bacterium]